MKKINTFIIFLSLINLSFSQNSISLISALKSDSQTVCFQDKIIDIIYTVSGATGANVTNLPQGITYNFVNDTLTIKGVSVMRGVFNYKITLIGGDGKGDANGFIEIKIPPTVLLSTNFSERNDTVVVCQDVLIDFTAKAQNLITPSYQWYLNGLEINGATKPIYSSSTLKSNDRIKVKMQSTDKCNQIVFSREIIVNISKPKLSLLINLPTSCGLNDGSINIKGSGTGTLSWQQGGKLINSVQNISLSNVNSYLIQKLSPGFYTIIFQDDAFCTYASNATIPAIPIPDRPILKVSEVIVCKTNFMKISDLNSLITNKTDSIEWFDNYINGKLMFPYDTLKNGIYYVRKINSLNCTSNLQESKVKISIIDNINSVLIDSIKNPIVAGDTLTLKLKGVQNCIWSSSDSTIAKIDKNTGKLTALSSGKVQITFEVIGLCNKFIDKIILEVNPTMMFGDIDSNQKIQVSDAELALKYSVGLNPLPIAPLPWSNYRMEIANVDTVGSITAFDASLILQKSLSIISDFPANYKKRGANSPKAKINISIDGNKLVFRCKGQLFGLNLVFNENQSNYAAPIILDKNIKIESNITENSYKIALASAYSIMEDSVFMIIPFNSIKEIKTLISLNISSDTLFSISSVASLNTLDNEDVLLFPNPSSDKITISNILGKSISIIGLNGIEIYNKSNALNEIEIPLKKDENKGIFLVYIKNFDGSIHKIMKLILQ